ncbi:MAG: DNA adenine methylase [Bacteroidetes bacterium]|nr:DNA adenine methylase [Bacteroidota bacterium]
MIATQTKETQFSFSGEDTSYLTHSLHPYPAKFPPQLPKKILEDYAFKGQTVLDPFCGSGTTLVEARIFGANAIGVDVNGLSVLLSQVKSTPLTEQQFSIVEDFISKIEKEISKWKSEKRPKIKIKEIEGQEHWFQQNVSEEITFLLNEISKQKDNDIQNFLKIVLSSIIVRVSNQDSDTRFAAIEKNINNGYTLETFCKRAKEYNSRMAEFSELVHDKTELHLHNADSRNLNFIPDNSVDIVITSPPYANTYDYYLYHKFRKRWLDLDVKFAQYNEIGSRREYSSLKEKKEKWNEDLIKCFAEMQRVLKPNHFAFIVIGDSVIKKELIKIEKEISDFAPKIGFKVNEILSSDLSKHSRIFNPTYAQKGKKEHLIILEKI